MRLHRGVVLGLTALACAAEGPDSRDLPSFGADGTEHSEVSPAAVDEGQSVATVNEARSIVVAKLRFSETHEIEFREYPDLHLITTMEVLHADLDRDHSSLRAKGVRPGLQPHEIYRIAAGPQADPTVIHYLQQAEERFAASRRPNINWTALRESGAIDSVSDPGAQRPKSEMSPAVESPVATLSQALCNEPVWDWLADETWFKNSYCYHAAQYCDTLDASHWSTVHGFEHGDSDHFNQSHCSRAFYEVWMRPITRCPDRPALCFPIIKIIRKWAAPRMIVSFNSYYDNSFTKWDAKITSEEGNPTGLAHFGWRGD